MFLGVSQPNSADGNFFRFPVLLLSTPSLPFTCPFWFSPFLLIFMPALPVLANFQPHESTAEGK